jgi:hypothetical protein
MELSPANPSFLDMRDSFPQADHVVNGVRTSPPAAGTWWSGCPRGEHQ